jgi:hypothetical protein
VQIAIVIGLRLDADRAHRGFEPELAQHDRSIAGDLDAGADLVQPLRLLEHESLDPVMTQGDRGGQPTDSAASYEHSHGSPPPLDNLSDFT